MIYQSATVQFIKTFFLKCLDNKGKLLYMPLLLPDSDNLKDHSENDSKYDNNENDTSK